MSDGQAPSQSPWLSVANLIAHGWVSATQTPHLQLDYRMAKEDFPLKSDTGHFTLPILSRIRFLVSRVRVLTLTGYSYKVPGNLLL